MSIISAQSGEKQSKDSESRGSEDESRDICPKCEREVPMADEICAYCSSPYVEHFLLFRLWKVALVDIRRLQLTVKGKGVLGR